MKNYIHFILLIFFVLPVMSCDNEQNENQEEVIEFNPYKTVKSDEICEITVPKYFVEIDDINPKAILQYGYIEEPDTVNKDYIEDEIYTIVLVDYKYELEQVYGDTLEHSIESFNKMCQDNLKMILDDFSAEYENPKVQIEGDMKSIHNEFLGRLDQYLVYYQIGVFETDKGYYQVLTWTLQEYMSKHKDEMLKMTTSFREL